jgi:hypothetical protein
MRRLTEMVTDLPDLLCFWTFQEPEGRARHSLGPRDYALTEIGGTIARADDGIFGPHAAVFGQHRAIAGPCLYIPRADCPALDVNGPRAQLTIVAWIKRFDQPEHVAQCQAVAGIWNEHDRRQYCMFLNLRIHESAEQVCAHISHTGGPTPGHRYCMDAAIGATPVPFDVWQCVAITYDSRHARAYLNGRLDSRGDLNPYRYPHGIRDAGPTGGDFTFGADHRAERVEMAADGVRKDHGSVQANCFRGLLGGLAIFDRALGDAELASISHATLPTAAESR